MNERIYNPNFSHIYVEKEIKNQKSTQEILAQFPNARVIEIDHYKDVFCRSGQAVERQLMSRALILAKKQGKLVYPGAKVCQSFDHDYFYYTSCVMNCIYNCEYCYLKGMYGSGFLVLFINLEDIFSELQELLIEHPVYLSVSYDTDILALESKFHLAEIWSDWVAKTNSRSVNQLTIEIRTKCGNPDHWKSIEPNGQVIYAFTISPDYVVKHYEHGTSGLKERLKTAGQLMEEGYQVRLCFDPAIYCPDWKMHYENMLELVKREVDLKQVLDISVGSFRISQDYLKRMRAVLPDSAITQFPYDNIEGVYQYPPALQEEMEQFIVERLAEEFPRERIFLWH